MNIIKELFDQRTPFIEIAKAAIDNQNLLNELLDGISPKNKNHNIRFACHKSLMELIKIKPDILYKYWNLFADLLKSKNAFHIVNAVYIITSLIAIDNENRFEEVYDDYFSQLYNPKVSVAAHVAKNSALIVKYNTELELPITELLLNYQYNADKFKHGELVKAYIIESFSDYYNISDKKEEILFFVKDQIESSSPKTRKAAINFLKKL